MTLDEILDRQAELLRWVETFTLTQSRPPFVREMAAAFRTSAGEIRDLVDRMDDLFLAHPGRSLDSQTVELEAD